MSAYMKETYRSGNSVIDGYLDYVEMNGGSPSTARTYGYQCLELDRFLLQNHGFGLSMETINQITAEMMVALYRSLDGKSVQTKNLLVNAMKGLFRYLVDMGYRTGHNPTAPLRTIGAIKEKHEAHPSEEEESKALTSEEAMKLMSHKSARNTLRNSAIVSLILGTGLRAFEVSELTVGTIRGMKDGMIYCHRKGDIWRHVPLPTKALNSILEYLRVKRTPHDGLGIMSPMLKDDEPLFTSTQSRSPVKNEFMSVRTIEHAISSMQKSLGLKTGVHRLRHTAITAVERVGGVAVARDIASHTNVAVTNRYLHSTPEERVAAAERLPWMVMAMNANPENTNPENKENKENERG